MEYSVLVEVELIEILKRYSFNFNFNILERDEILFLPIQFSVKQNYDFYPCIFGFFSQLFEEELVKDLFSYQASHLEAIDKKKFIIHFAFLNKQRLL
ncbi:hypothetical protein C1631_022745 [Chryseobacterium phosphatilyticum]|uniref:Uncharacterized protein n=1 Tax=Chryseobacterium phosphatilyticum TaxID=475075 RepID=A0A316WPG5_9FLAO|nr:hypothetical protein [Chryseobacterium phosphatilyticum]PWN62386.1 hypothetical protein C1631_022745 [Chryseobacterium phosphatilyticum]